MLAAAIAVLVTLPAAVPPGASAAARPPITLSEAREGLADAEAARDEATVRLDALAEEFERARAHAERLAADLDAADVSLAAAQVTLDEAQQARRDHLREAYMVPGIDLVRSASALLLAPDLGTALHVSGTMTMLAGARAEAAERVRTAAEGTADDLRNQRGILTGSGAAMEDLRRLSTVMTDALEDATVEVARAEEGVADAEARAVLDARLESLPPSYAGPAGVVAAPPVRQVTLPGGTQVMGCPIGQPNAFIDSWGFPRSGGRTHKGVDMFAAHGMPLFAAAGGVVDRVYDNALGGLSIDLRDGLGNRYYYAHLSAALVSGGQVVAVGDPIGLNGNSGNAIATPPHLHWQFHPGGGGPINPFPLAAALCR